MSARRCARPHPLPASPGLPGRAHAAPATSGASVLDLLAGRPDMGTLVRAVAAAGLADELADPSFVGTVFAPNDTAFEALLERVLVNETVEELLADKPRLADLLGYHVVPGEALAAAALVDGLNLTTAEGELLQVRACVRACVCVYVCVCACARWGDGGALRHGESSSPRRHGPLTRPPAPAHPPPRCTSRPTSRASRRARGRRCGWW